MSCLIVNGIVIHVVTEHYFLQLVFNFFILQEKTLFLCTVFCHVTVNKIFVKKNCDPYCLYQSNTIVIEAWKVILAGGMGGMCFWALSYPVDVVKSKLQVIWRFSHLYCRNIVEANKSLAKTQPAGFVLVRNQSKVHRVRSFPANIYLFRVSDRNTRKRFKICSDLIIEIPELRWLCFDVFIVSFERISHVFLVFLLLNLNK